VFVEDFTTGVYVNKCVNEKLFPHCNYVWSNEELDLFVGCVFNENWNNGNRPEDDRYK